MELNRKNQWIVIFLMAIFLVTVSSQEWPFIFTALVGIAVLIGIIFGVVLMGKWLINKMNINKKEDNVMSEEELVAREAWESSLEHALQELEGNPYIMHTGKHGGHVLVETCDHTACIEEHEEGLWEWMNGDWCCDEDPCPHYSAWLCKYHVPAPVVMEAEEFKTVLHMLLDKDL